MFSLSAILVALLLFPALLCTLILRLFFPKNTLKINDAFLFSSGLAYTLVVNLFIIFKVFDLLIPKCCISTEGFETYFYLNILEHHYELCGLYLAYLVLPTSIFGFTVFCLSKIYQKSATLHAKRKNSLVDLRTIKCLLYFRGCCSKGRPNFNNKNRLKPVIKFERSLSQKTFSAFKNTERILNDNLINYMGQMTQYQPKREQLFVDVLAEDDSLYSGIFSEYFLDDKKFVGLKLTNIIRYSFKAEKDRKDDGQGKFELPYLLPNNGEMYFSADKIKNLHFWKIKKNHTERMNLGKKYNHSRFVWWFGVRYSLPNLTINVEGFFPPNTPDDFLINEIYKGINTLKLNDIEREIENSIEIHDPEIPDAEDNSG